MNEGYYSLSLIKVPPFCRYKELFEKGKVQKALKCCQEYLGKMEELNIPFPHRNYEISAIALCSCLWAIASRKTDEKIKQVGIPTMARGRFF